MTNYQFSKFKSFIVHPDLGNKFLLPVQRNIIPLKSFNIYFKYIFSNKQTFGSLGIKVLLMMESIYPKRPNTARNFIALKFGRTRVHSLIYLKLNLDDIIYILSYYIKKPISISTTMNSYLKQTYFSFPGFINKLKFPSWERNVILTFKHIKQDQYIFFFYKTLFLD
jgi:hypothetical protein